MRQIQRQVRVKEETARQPVKALWKSDKYEGVQSKVYEQMKVANSKLKFILFDSLRLF